MKLLSTKEASEVLKISARMVQYYTKTGRLKIYRIVGKGYLYTEDQVNRLKRLLAK